MVIGRPRKPRSAGAMATSEDLAAYLALAEEVAREAGRRIREAHEQRSQGLAGLESKGSEETQTVDLVTEMVRPVLSQGIDNKFMILLDPAF